MLRAMIRRVHPEQVETLRDWFQQVQGPRRDEAIATLADETCRHEMALLIEGADGPVIVSLMEVEVEEQSRVAGKRSTHVIDADHKRVLDAALGERVPTEVLLDLRRDPD